MSCVVVEVGRYSSTFGVGSSLIIVTLNQIIIRPTDKIIHKSVHMIIINIEISISY